MTRSIILLSFTDKGAAALFDSPHRAEAFNELAAKSGVTVDGQYWTLWSHDGVLVLAADKEEKIVHLLAQLASLGNVRTESMRAFTASEFEAALRG